MTAYSQMVTSLKFFVREHGNVLPVFQLTSNECDAIQECVEDLIPTSFQGLGSLWFEADMCTDDEASYGLLRCFSPNPNPTNGSLAASRLPAEFPPQVLDVLKGKTCAVRPRQFGLSPWGERVEIVFETD
jgi:hypothetical protein